MGRTRKKNRRSQSNRKINSGPNGGNNLDRDDDCAMLSPEHDGLFSPVRSRGRQRNRNDNRQDRGTGWQNSNPLSNNPPQTCGPDNPAHPGSRSERRRRNQNRNRNRNRNWDRSRSRSRSRQAADIDSNGGGRSPPGRHPGDHHRSRLAPASSPSPGPARQRRFCTECSAVRRANLTLRDWATGAGARVFGAWADEVGVGRGSGDEMDWQPEPVVRVLILTGAAPIPPLPPPRPTPPCSSSPLSSSIAAAAAATAATAATAVDPAPVVMGMGSAGMSMMRHQQ